MVRLAFRGAVGVLAAALATGGCLGGQTGHSFGGCDSESLESGADWGGTTVLGAAQAFEGTYTASLGWKVESRSATTHTAVELPDSVQLTINYDGGTGTQSCDDELSVPVLVTLTTSESGLAESGGGTLSVAAAPDGGRIGTLHFETSRVRFDATLDPPTSTMRGSFDALDPDLPGASATFQ